MTAFIKNAKALGTTKLRRDALAILSAGLSAINTKAAVRRAVSRRGKMLRVGHATYDLSSFRRVLVIAIGKAAFDAASELETILGRYVTDGLVLDVKGGALKRLTSRVGTHPFPSEANMKATGEILALLRDAREGDLIVMPISGGGSALLCWPNQLTCGEMAMITRTLMKKGATIEEMNTVRKHTSDILGGQAAAVAHRARIVGLIFSDVPGDDLPMVASGPTFLDTTTAADAAQVLAAYDLMRVCKLPSCDVKETPKDPALFARVENVLVVSNAVAAEAMRGAGTRRGYAARVLTTTLGGEARAEGARLAREPQPGEAVIAAGETVVTVRGGGTGGRNQELALGALAHVGDDALVLSCASDGVDNTPAAGAIADAVTRAAVKAKRLDPAAALRANDSYPFFAKAGAQIKTGPLDSNVSDVMLALRLPALPTGRAGGRQDAKPRAARRRTGK